MVVVGMELATQSNNILNLLEYNGEHNSLPQADFSTWMDGHFLVRIEDKGPYFNYVST